MQPLPVHGFEPPLTPDGDEARRLLLEELAKAKYQQRELNIIDRIINTLIEWFGNLGEGASAIPNLIVYAVGLLLIAAIVYAIIKFGVPKLNRSSKVRAETVFGDHDERTSKELRQASEQAARASDWYQATILRFRAIARQMEERTVIDLAPSLTAQTFSAQLSTSFPQHAEGLAYVAAAFDQVRYLLRPGTEHDYHQLRQLDEQLEKSTPVMLQRIGGDLS